MKTNIDDYRPPDDGSLPLFRQPAPPAQRHSATSVAAAQSQTASKTACDRLRILELIEQAGPLTDEEIGERAGIGANTVRPRRGELVREGLVVRVDDAGRTATGHRASRWGRA